MLESAAVSAEAEVLAMDVVWRGSLVLVALVLDLGRRAGLLMGLERLLTILGMTTLRASGPPGRLAVLV